MLPQRRNPTVIAQLAAFTVCLMATELAAAPAATPLKLSPESQARCVTILRDSLKSDEFWPSMHAAEALTLAGHPDEVRAALEPLFATETDDRHRCGLAREMVRAGDVSRLHLLLEVLAKDDPYGHVHAAESLYKVGRTGDGRLLRAALDRQDNPTLQIMAAAALARCGNPYALPLIRHKLADDDMTISRIAGWVLARLGDPSDIGPLQNALKRADDPLARCFLEQALAALGDAEGQEALIRNLSSTEPAARTYAAVFAGEIGMHSAADLLIKLLDDPEEDVRIRAAQALLTLAQPKRPDPRQDISADVYPATDEYPRISEGSIIELHDGSLLYAVTEFIRGTADAASAHIVTRRSTDQGRTWGPKRVLQENIGKENVMSVTLRRLPRQENPQHPLGMFYLVKNGPNDLDVHLRISLDEARTFGPPILVTDAPGYHIMNNDRVTVLSTGRIVAPMAWSPDIRKLNHFVSFCYLSDDAGHSWRRSKGEVDLPKRGAMEPEVLELSDGRLVMILRTQLGHIATAYSDDRGDTWSEPAQWTAKAPESPATLRRVPSTGDLLLIWNNNYQPGTGHGGLRTPLTAAISSDEGRTWTNVRDLESRADQTYSYPSLLFVGPRAVIGYYVSDKKTGRISSRFRSLPVAWFYESADASNR
jgi:sialidase-1